VSLCALSINVRKASWKLFTPDEEAESSSSSITTFGLPSIDMALQNSDIFVLSTSNVPSVAHFTNSVSAFSDFANSFARVVFPLPCTPAKRQFYGALFATIALK
jgi:hypothetical protein